MKSCVITSTILLLINIALCALSQTCDNIKYTTINDARRSTKYRSENTICDQDFIEEDKWYRFNSITGTTMPTKDPGVGSCGTYLALWFRGIHPKTDNVIVDATACAARPFRLPIGCGISYKIKVIKCGTFYLYRLKKPDRCNVAYCAGILINHG